MIDQPIQLPSIITSFDKYFRNDDNIIYFSKRNLSGKC